jgi:thiamine biosynthesis lipoprotein
MGTLVTLRVEATSEALALAGLEAAWGAILEVEGRMHPMRPGSDLAAMNAAPLHAYVAAHPLTLQLLRLAQDMYRASGGVFDPCLPQAVGHFEDLQLLDGGVRCRRRLHMDLGGIAKGFAVDRAIAAARAAGCSAGGVNAGGDLRVFGPQAEDLRLGHRGGRAVRLKDAALAVSAIGPGAPPEHRGYYCRIEGTTRRCDAAAVVAPSAALADALTKCALFMPEERAARLCAARGAQLLPAAWLCP